MSKGLIPNFYITNLIIEARTSESTDLIHIHTVLFRVPHMNLNLASLTFIYTLTSEPLLTIKQPLSLTSLYEIRTPILQNLCVQLPWLSLIL